MKDQDLEHKTLVIFGGAGFIGSNFIRQILTKYSDITVVNVDALTYAGRRENLSDFEDDDRYTFVEGDITDQDHIREILVKHKPDYIVNFAAETHVDRSVQGFAKDFVKTNVEGVFVLLELVKENPVEKFLHVSTDEVYGTLELDSNNAFTEESPFQPNNPYAAAKAGGDLLCRSYHTAWGVPVVVTHCSNNYGPYQYPEKLIPFLISRVQDDKKVPLYGDGKHVRDWVHVLDHCDALERCLVGAKPGSVYVIGGGHETSNFDIAKRILAFFGKDESYIEYVDDRPGHDRRYSVDSSKIQKDLGWSIQRDFDTEFEKTLQWYVDNQDWIESVKNKDINQHIKN